MRTKGVGGKTITSIEGGFDGEVTFYSSEVEKARLESLDRVVEKATRRGANAVVGADLDERHPAGHRNGFFGLWHGGNYQTLRETTAWQAEP